MTRLGIFVGGASSRMGTPKGLLLRNGETLVERAVRVGREAGLEPMLIGEASPYASVCPDVPRVPDDPGGEGPLGGLRAFLRGGDGIVWACDMPNVEVEHLQMLSQALFGLAAMCVREDRREGHEGGQTYEPFLAAYSSSLLPLLDAFMATGGRSFQRLLGGLAPELVHHVALHEQTLRDWDVPADVC